MFKPVDNSINFPEMEKKWLKHWYEKGIDKKYRDKNKKSKKYFSFLDGPITANNPMGVHHAWGRTYKDLWMRFFNLFGYNQRFQNGFDCQGLWVEVEVEKELGLKTKKDIENLVPGDKKASIAKFVQLCKDRVKKFSGIQTEQSKRLGYFADWDHSYFTMSDENNYMIWYFLKTCFEHGWIYKGHESVPWCPRCETAISQHEMLTEDYKELVHESIYLRLPIDGRKDEYLLVWTTTPWTIPANIAVAVDESFDYVLIEASEKRKYWVVKELAKQIFGNDFVRIIKTVKGKELIGLKYKGPFDDLPAVSKVASENKKFHTVIPTDEKILPISVTEGTGMVHTAVSAGVEDFKLGKKLGLPMIPVIADNADYIEGLGFLSGKNAKKNPRVVLDYLEENNWAYKIHNYKHRYPACWRCKTELVWKVADEWYIAMDKPSVKTKQTLRKMMIGVAKKIIWMPEFGLDRELDWLKNMHDWLISKKNRYWGLALPIYECKKCGTFDVIGSKEELKKKAVKGWSQFVGKSPHKPFIDDIKIKCKKCGEAINRIDDVGNPWLDAGIVSYSTITENNQGEPLYLKNKSEWKHWFPADFITEGFAGQFKNWFYALIAESTVLENTNPFKRVLGYGTVLGEDGRAMHKSWGNAIEFNEGADKIGVDVMRWMFTRSNPSENVLFGYKKADEVRRQFYLILWNVYKFFIEYANLDKFDVSRSTFHASQLGNVLDRWILSRLVWLVQYVEKSMKDYDAKNASLEIEKFVSDLSTWFIRRSRDRVWINSENELDKTQFYQALYYILQSLSIILSPFIPFISEEIYISLTNNESVHLANWPKIDTSLYDEKLEKEMEEVRKQVEAAHAVRKSMNIKVRIPLAELKVDLTENVKISDEVYEIALKEINAKNLLNKTRRYPSVEVRVTKEELEREGALRDLLRTAQAKRKELGLKPTDTIKITILEQFKSDAPFIKKKLLAREVAIGKELTIEI
jgi:isoleucyl-tRNA synthetase